MTLNDVMAAILRYFTEFGKHIVSQSVQVAVHSVWRQVTSKTGKYQRRRRSRLTGIPDVIRGTLGSTSRTDSAGVPSTSHRLNGYRLTSESPPRCHNVHLLTV